MGCTVRCLTAARMNMKATILRQGDVTGDPLDPSDLGVWVESQDPLTFEIVEIWEPLVITVDDPLTAISESVVETFYCLARGIVDGGIRVAGTTERFGDTYENIDFVKMWVPSNFTISKRDRITNISDPRGSIIWVDEEASVPRATVFNVNGVTPLLDAFNNHVENFVLLERAEI